MDLFPTIVYMDENLLVVNKPPGLLSIPDGYDPDKAYLQSLLEPQFGKLWLVHRLDKDTSGVILMARNEYTHRHLNDQFSNHLVEKIYRAIVVGVPPWNEIEISRALRSNVGRRKRTIVDDRRGKSASTSVRLLKRLRDHALIEARPKTGRTHQIRVHLYSLGYPILADPLYGDCRGSQLISSLALHARSITCTHPTSGDRVSFDAPESNEFLKTLQVLSRP